jgi:uncharacterized protein (DUF4415 family)
MKKRTEKEEIVTFIGKLPDGSSIVEHADGRLERRRSQTDWAAVDALTDEQIEDAVARDPDAVPLDFDWSEAVLVFPAKKKAISIRIDEDVLNFFKKSGEGYQKRMNAVLRSYMQQKSRPKKRA